MTNGEEVISHHQDKNGLIGFRFGDFLLDLEQDSLLKDGSPVRIPRKTFEILALLVQNAGRIVDKNEIMERVWPETFVEDANLTVHISRLRKTFGSDPGTKIETFAKQGYRFVSEVEPVVRPAAGAPVAEVPVAGELPGTHALVEKRSVSRRWVGAAALALAIVFVFAFVPVSWFYPNPARADLAVSSIAVLPIRNETGDDTLEFLADGITEDVIRSLSHLPKVVVKSRSTVFRYKGKEIDPREAGKDLSVDTVLVGKMTKVDQGIAVSFELLRTTGGDIIVSDRIERSVDDSSSIHLEIAKTIETKLGRAEAIESRALIRGDAYQYYLRGRYSLERRTIPELRNAAQFFQKSIDADPGLALAYSGLADAYALMSDYGALSRADSIPKAKASALRAIELDPDLAEAHASLGAILADNEGDAAAAEAEFRRAIELDPNYASAHQWHAELLTSLGRFDEAKVVIHRAIQLDPLSRIMRGIDARISLFSGDADEAIAICRKNIDLDPKWGGDHDLLFHAYAAKNMFAEAADAHLTSIELLGVATDEEIRHGREAFAKGGWDAFLKERLLAYERRATKEFVRPLVLAEWNSRLGNMDAAYRQASEALGEGSVTFSGVIRFLPAFENFRRDPRYKEFSSRLTVSK